MKAFRKLYLIVLLVLCTASGLLAQDKTINGSQGQKLLGVCYIETTMPESRRLAEMTFKPMFQDQNSCRKYTLDGPLRDISNNPKPCRVPKATKNNRITYASLDSIEFDLDDATQDAIMKNYAAKCEKDSNKKKKSKP
jgi:hypothetical protein